jgi:hypothetical protein
MGGTSALSSEAADEANDDEGLSQGAESTASVGLSLLGDQGG